MKKIIYLVFAVLIINGCSSEPKFVVTGNIQDSDSVNFFLQKREAGAFINLDSAISKKGIFKMTGAVEFPEMVYLVAASSRERLSFYLENTDIAISGKLDSLSYAKVSGSKTQDEYQAFIESNKPLNEKYSNLYTEYQSATQANNTEEVARLEKEAEVIQNEMTQLEKDFVKNNPSSYVSPSILKSLSYDMEAVEIEEAISAMDTNVAKTPVAKDLLARAQVMKAVAVGQKAPDFTLNDVDGNPVALYSKVGAKLLLVDFWAAWCNPCRQENPNVVKVYKEFSKKGFYVFGVSLDREKEAWLKAIADDKLTWTHVSDLQYWNNAAAKLYAVNAIPANFLLDENGTIIARNLRGEDLYNKVKEILGK
ncbi:MAG: TlpA disulfide reductase family protein [Bacteroidia bacterium]|nr:TlpA disulfide reductase family protein [Bacteroidia bacterium]